MNYEKGRALKKTILNCLVKRVGSEGMEQH
jgi:hypothetical protein